MNTHEDAEDGEPVAGAEPVPGAPAGPAAAEGGAQTRRRPAKPPARAVTAAGADAPSRLNFTPQMTQFLKARCEADREGLKKPLGKAAAETWAGALRDSLSEGSPLRTACTAKQTPNSAERGREMSARA